MNFDIQAPGVDFIVIVPTALTLPGVALGFALLLALRELRGRRAARSD